ncbi:hypothetical protein [Paludisphaera borealis]|uniref:hypothetical protein n=1 Tax=Paludisphaera borealis TaxID=1387353 RepID=UPI000970C9E3|nr:hypothetical protein [Paludisphaera borealis]
MNPATDRRIQGWQAVLYGIAILCAPAMHGHGPRSGEGSNENVIAESVPSGAEFTHGDCSVCHFLAQTSLPPECGSAHPAPAVAGPVDHDAPLLKPHERRGKARPRAPPPA